MKLISIFVAILLFCNLSSLSQTKEINKQEKKNIFAISIGVWERDISRSTGTISHKIGPYGSLEYQRRFNQYLSFSGKLFGGGIYNRDFDETLRHLGVSAGILVTPIGDKFSNFKIGVAPLYKIEQFMSNSNRIDKNFEYHYSSWWGFEVPIQFYLFDKPNWYLGLEANFKFGYNVNGYENFCLSTFSPSITYGLKF